MCTELILAILYFLAIFLVNFFLAKIIEKLFETFFYYLKIEMILKKFTGFSQKEILFFCIQGKKITNPFIFLDCLPYEKKMDDILLLGQMYQFLFKKNNFQNLTLINQKNQEKINFLSSQMYLNLVKIQYLT